MRALVPVWLDGKACGYHALCCQRFLPRLLGAWVFKGRLPARTVVFLSPCWCVHTLLLPRPIEVAFCDEAGYILKLVVPLGAPRFASCRQARVAWELPVGSTLRLGLAPGRRLQWAPEGWPQ